MLDCVFPDDDFISQDEPARAGTALSFGVGIIGDKRQGCGQDMVLNAQIKYLNTRRFSNGCASLFGTMASNCHLKYMMRERKVGDQDSEYQQSWFCLVWDVEYEADLQIVKLSSHHIVLCRKAFWFLGCFYQLLVSVVPLHLQCHSCLRKKRSYLLNQCLFLEFLISILLTCLAIRHNYFLLNFSCKFPLFSLQRCFIYQSINSYILDQSTSCFCFNTSLAIRNDTKGKYN